MKEKIIICPNEEKMNILDKYSNDEKLYNIKFMTKQEYIDNYYYSYDERALEYLMNKYDYNLDVCKVYLSNLYVIDITKDYKNNKLKLLKNIKKELLDNNLLEENKAFKDYLNNKEIIVKNYYDLDLYEEKALNYKKEEKEYNLNTKVVKCDTLEEEVNQVCLNIIELLNKNIDINKIFIGNVSSDYLYTINKLFKYYKIPINLDMNNSIYSTKVVNDYLNNNILDLESNDKITKKLVNVISSLSMLDQSKDSYKKILKDKLKNTSIGSNRLSNAVNVIDINKRSINDDEYVFVLGFNQDNLPVINKDIDFITDNMKDEVPMYTTKET